MSDYSDAMVVELVLAGVPDSDIRAYLATGRRVFTDNEWKRYRQDVQRYVELAKGAGG